MLTMIIMPVKLDAWMLSHKDLQAHYKIDYEGSLDDFSIGNALWTIREAKRRFHMPGTMFLLFVNKSTYLVTKVDKDWKAYEYSFSLQEPQLSSDIQTNIPAE